MAAPRRNRPTGLRKERSFPHDSANWPKSILKRKSGAARERIVPPRPISAARWAACSSSEPPLFCARCPLSDTDSEIALGFLERVNRTPVSPKLLGEAMELHANMAPEDRPVFEARAFQLFEFLKEKGFTGRRHSDLALAIEFLGSPLSRSPRSGRPREGVDVGRSGRGRDPLTCGCSQRSG